MKENLVKRANREPREMVHAIIPVTLETGIEDHELQASSHKGSSEILSQKK
jgi:hypothetical protein